MIFLGGQPSDGGGGSCLRSIRCRVEVHIIAHIRKNIYFISSSISVPFFASSY